MSSLKIWVVIQQQPRFGSGCGKGGCYGGCVSQQEEGGCGQPVLAALRRKHPESSLETSVCAYYILFDTGVQLSFIYRQFVKKLHLQCALLILPLVVTSSLGGFAKLSEEVRLFPIRIQGRLLYDDLVVMGYLETRRARSSGVL